ncbi:uncharacterized protein LOC114456424 isoform X1 [Gouania willdenowi]|uniref:Uncharacterized LOC114456424 n=1 Tax=Gouania willdenowi TaxID=441366 RepID=A0A8C5HUF4_GOUWI|nr:uncharacterized protein LOC114456424 isoform X1 [Gouania willdenowi]
MDLCEAQTEIKMLVNRVNPTDVIRLLEWMKNSDELYDVLKDNKSVTLRSIADDLRLRLPLDAMLTSESSAHCKMQQRSKPTVHVDSFLYDEEGVESLCEGGALSRTYCLSCGSTRTAPLDFISHSFSVAELQFIFQNVLPDLSNRTLMDVGSRLGAVLYGGFLYSSASLLLGVEINEEFVRLQNEMLLKYGMTDRAQVVHGDVRAHQALLKRADVLILNNVFEFFMEHKEQVRVWRSIMECFTTPGSLMVTVPSLQESLSALQEALPPGWVEEVPLNYESYVSPDADPDALREIHLYRVM